MASFSKKKAIEIVAGPNGSGKTTFAKAYFKLRNGDSRFINADTIAQGLSAGNEQEAAFHAGRVMLGAIREALQNAETFAFESTLSGKAWEPLLKEAVQNGYRLTIYFVYLEKVSVNIQRIRQRVQEGGHSIPKETVMRRFPRSFRNFWTLYRPLCYEWFLFDNSGSKPKQVQSKMSFGLLSSSEQNDFMNSFMRAGITK